MSSTRDLVQNAIKYRAGALCLVGILASTYLHNAAFMAQFFYGSIILGGIAALAIDAGVISMAIFKDELLKDGQLAWMVRIVTVLVLLCSGVANMSEGFKSAYGQRLTVDAVAAMDMLTLVQWLMGTIVFPILAYVMSDTIGTRNLIDMKQAEEKRAASAAPSPAPRAQRPAAARQQSGRPIDAANASIQRNKQDRMRVLEDYIERHPNATLSEMAEVVGVSSRETVRKYLNEMGHRSQFSRN